MKEVLPGILVMLAAFFAGIFAAEVARILSPEPFSPPVVAEVEIAEKIPVSEEELFEPEEEIPLAEEVPIYGWYAIDTPRKMSEVNMILLSRDHLLSDGTPSRKPVSSAGVFTTFGKYGDQGFIDSAWAEVTDKTAKFRSKKIKGIEYRFSGIFFKNKTSGMEGEKVLRGTLQKFIKGKKVAEVSGDFGYYEPQCWH